MGQITGVRVQDATEKTEHSHDHEKPDDASDAGETSYRTRHIQSFGSSRQLRKLDSVRV